MTDFFASTVPGLEDLLTAELQQLDIRGPKISPGGVYFSSELAQAYQLLLCSRVTNRLTLVLARDNCRSDDDLYRISASIPWEQHFNIGTTFAVSFHGKAGWVRNSMFAGLRIKDGVVDRFRAQTGDRPDVDSKTPQLRVTGYLKKDRLTLGLDLTGDSLHRRGYRQQAGSAPLKENLAAAILLRCRWPDPKLSHEYLLDPMCGSGTLLIEAGLILTQTAPGLLRSSFGFEHWSGHQPELWHAQQEIAAAKQQTVHSNIPVIYGYDQDPKMISIAKRNIKAAGLEPLIQVKQGAVENIDSAQFQNMGQGLLVTNPPYGERIGEQTELVPVYRALGQKIAQMQGWRASIFSGNPELVHEIGIQQQRANKMKNGAIPCVLAHYQRSDQETAERLANRDKKIIPKFCDPLANRIKKNQRNLSKWIKQNGIHCYRVYDADIPEFSLAIDRYENSFCIQEYAAPKTIEPAIAQKRLIGAVKTVAAIFDIDQKDIAVKQRTRQRGSNQYQRLEQKNEFFAVKEGPHQFLVNLYDYLDTGLFLDHRPMRNEIADRIQQATQASVRNSSRPYRFLNLFCYTATATVYAAKAGAGQSVSVDMSHSYCSWAIDNLQLNDIDTHQHQVIRADCIVWLEQSNEQFDLIYLDPPTFSNSKKMEDTFDIQRDHVNLIKSAAARLAPGGVLLFSNNFRKFRLDKSALPALQITDISNQLIDPDFQRNKKIHHCWEILRDSSDINAEEKPGKQQPSPWNNATHRRTSRK